METFKKNNLRSLISIFVITIMIFSNVSIYAASNKGVNTNMDELTEEDILDMKHHLGMSSSTIGPNLMWGTDKNSYGTHGMIVDNAIDILNKDSRVVYNALYVNIGNGVTPAEVIWQSSMLIDKIDADYRYINTIMDQMV